ncbi:hypothetical protein Adt_21203 [Abeliophyllum distichum]|uniref:Uncharacterized protein n=1 Tax=Abeliophyllum distichum TaxID=126358 RepID=A0ABD1SYS8_9LAMI
MSHGDDGAGDPPHQPPRRFDSSYKFTPPSKRYGISRGINLEKVWQANEKKHFPSCSTMSNIQCSRSRITRSILRTWFSTKLGSSCPLATLPGQRFQSSSGHCHVTSSRINLLRCRRLKRLRSPLVAHRLTSVLLQEELSKNDEDTSVGLDEFRRFATYKDQLRCMKRTIACLTVNLEYRLPGIVPDDVEEVAEDENVDGSLGDL